MTMGSTAAIAKVSATLLLHNNGWGNYLPGLHNLIEGMRSGARVKGASVNAG